MNEAQSEAQKSLEKRLKNKCQHAIVKMPHFSALGVQTAWESQKAAKSAQDHLASLLAHLAQHQHLEEIKALLNHEKTGSALWLTTSSAPWANHFFEKAPSNIVSWVAEAFIYPSISSISYKNRAQPENNRSYHLSHPDGLLRIASIILKRGWTDDVLFAGVKKLFKDPLFAAQDKWIKTILGRSTRHANPILWGELLEDLLTEAPSNKRTMDQYYSLLTESYRGARGERNPEAMLKVEQCFEQFFEKALKYDYEDSQSKSKSQPPGSLEGSEAQWLMIAESLSIPGQAKRVWPLFQHWFGAADRCHFTANSGLRKKEFECLNRSIYSYALMIPCKSFKKDEKYSLVTAALCHSQFENAKELLALGAWWDEVQCKQQLDEFKRILEEEPLNMVDKNKWMSVLNHAEILREKLVLFKATQTSAKTSSKITAQKVPSQRL